MSALTSQSLPTSAPRGAFRETLESRGVLDSRSVATTRDAPACSMATETRPHPAPSSQTRRPRNVSWCFSMNFPSTMALSQTVLANPPSAPAFRASSKRACLKVSATTRAELSPSSASKPARILVRRPWSSRARAEARIATASDFCLPLPRPPLEPAQARARPVEHATRFLFFFFIGVVGFSRANARRRVRRLERIRHAQLIAFVPGPAPSRLGRLGRRGRRQRGSSRRGRFRGPRSSVSHRTRRDPSRRDPSVEIPRAAGPLRSPPRPRPRLPAGRSRSRPRPRRARRPRRRRRRVPPPSPPRMISPDAGASSPHGAHVALRDQQGTKSDPSEPRGARSAPPATTSSRRRRSPSSVEPPLRFPTRTPFGWIAQYSGFMAALYGESSSNSVLSSVATRVEQREPPRACAGLSDADGLRTRFRGVPSGADVRALVLPPHECQLVPVLAPDVRHQRLPRCAAADAGPHAHGEVLERPGHELAHVRPVVDEKLAERGVGRALRASGSTNGVMRRSTSKPFRSTTSKCLSLRVPLCLRSLRSSRAASARAPPPAEHAASEAFAGAGRIGSERPGRELRDRKPTALLRRRRRVGAPPPAASPLASRGQARRPIECRRRRASRGTKKKSVRQENGVR